MAVTATASGTTRPNDLYEHSENLVRESISGRMFPIDAQTTIEQMWDECVELYNGDQPGGRGKRTGIQYTTINKVEGSVITDVANATKIPPKTFFKPTDQTDDEAVYYVARKVRKMYERGQFDLARQFATERQLKSLDPIDEDIAQQILDLLIPTNPALEESDLIAKVTDSIAADAFSQVYNTITELSGRNKYVNDNKLWTSVVGIGWLGLSWDYQKSCFRYRNWPVRNVFPDPSAEWIDDMDYLQIEYTLSLVQAEKLWPEKVKKLREAKMTGTLGQRRSQASHTATYWPKEGGVWTNSLSGQFENTDYQRDMVLVRVLWERHHDYDMTVNEAIDMGYVREQTVIEEDETERIVLILLDEDGNDVTPIEEADKDWPQISHIRQAVLLPDLGSHGVVSDERCPFMDIPIGQNKNVPILGTPYGKGEPFRLKGPQRALNTAMTNVATYIHYFREQQAVVPQEYLDLISRRGKPFAGPGKWWGIPREFWDDWMRDKDSFFLSPPPLPNHAINMLIFLSGEIDKLGGNVDVLQGIDPGDASGRKILALQSEGKSPIQYKTSHHHQMLTRLVRIEADAILNMLSEHRAVRILGKYDPSVAMAIWRRVKSVRWDISVQVAGSDGMDDQTRSQMAGEAVARGMMDPLTYHEIVRLVPDPHKVLERLRQFGIIAGPSPGDQGAGAAAPPPGSDGASAQRTVATQAQNNTPGQNVSLSNTERNIGV